METRNPRRHKKVLMDAIRWSRIWSKESRGGTLLWRKRSVLRGGSVQVRLVSALGIAGVSLVASTGGSPAEMPSASMAAPTAGSVADTLWRDTASFQVPSLDEEEISDVSLATFHLFDKEDLGNSVSGMQLAAFRGCGCGHGCGGCRGCGGVRGCRGGGFGGCRGGCRGCGVGGCRGCGVGGCGWGGCGGCGGCGWGWGGGCCLSWGGCSLWC